MMLSAWTWPPLLAAELFALSLTGNGVENLNVVLNVAAIVTLVAGFFVVARYKAALDASESSSSSWQSEAEAAERKADRLEVENVALTKRIAELESKTDLTLHETQAAERHRVLVEELRAAFGGMKEGQSEIATALVAVLGNQRQGG